MAAFNFNGHELRTIEIDGAVFFSAPDACRCLGLPIGGKAGGATRHLRRLDADEKRTVRAGEAICVPLFQNTPAPSMTLISESGLYKLIMRSDKTEACEFQNWVTKEVLPTIRKTGSW